MDLSLPSFSGGDPPEDGDTDLKAVRAEQDRSDTAKPDKEVENAVRLWKCRMPILEDLRSEDVLPRLELERVFSQEENKTITNEITTQGKTIKLLMMLQEKIMQDPSGKIFQAVSQILEETYPHLADVLNQEHVTEEDIEHYQRAPLPLDQAILPTAGLLSDQQVVQLLGSELRYFYSHNLQYLTPVPWNEAFQVKTARMFTPLKVISIPVDQLSTKSLHQVLRKVGYEGLPMHMLFEGQDGDTPPKHILLEGEPGIGKTTSCQIMALDWSQNCEEFSALKNYDLVFYLQGRYLDDTSLIEAIFSHLLAEEFSTMKDQVLQALQDSSVQERSLFIVDGYDELPNPNADLRKLLHWKKCSRSTVVMTTRPTMANDIVKCFDAYFFVLGFHEEESKEFIKKYAAQICVENMLEEKLSENIILKDMSRNPMYLSFLCLLGVDNQGDLPETRTELFDEVVQLLLRKSANKYMVDLDTCLQANDSLCSIAFDCALSGKLSVEEVDLKQIWNGLDNVPLCLGLLSKEMGPSRLNPKARYTFSHKSIQEFLAAKYLCGLDEDERMQTLTGLKTEASETILVFICGLLKAKGSISALNKLLEAVICKDLSEASYHVAGVMRDESKSHSDHHLGLNCLAECGMLAKMEELTPQLVPPCFFYHPNLCQYCLQGFAKVHSCRVPSNNPDLVLLLDHQFKFDQNLFHAVKSFRNMPSVVLSSVQMISELFQTLTKICSARVDLRHLFIYLNPFMNPIEGNITGLLGDFQACVPSLQSLETLVFRGSSCRWFKGAESLAEISNLMMDAMCTATAGKKLRVLALDEHTIPCSAALKLADNLRASQTLMKVFLHGIVIERDSFETLLDALSDCHNLESLGVMQCAEEPQGKPFYIPDSVCKVVKDCPLKHLSLRQCNIQASILNVIEALQHYEEFYNNKLESFDIAGNRLSEESFEAMQTIISHSAAVTSLLLSYIGMTGSQMVKLCQTLAHLPNLQEIDLSGNAMGAADSFTEFCLALNKLPQLCKITLDNCGLTDSSIPDLLLLFHNPSVTHMSLLANDIGATHDTASYFVSILQGTTSLVSLEFSLGHPSIDILYQLTCALQMNTNLNTLVLKCKATPNLMVICPYSDHKVYFQYVKENLPGVKNGSFGFFTDLNYRKDGESLHQKWRLECFGIVA